MIHFKIFHSKFCRELMAKAPFGLVSVLDPVLKHCDLHAKWEPPPIFAVYTFRAIMYSVKDPSFVIQVIFQTFSSFYQLVDFRFIHNVF